jgi:hypothetical protein
MLYARAALYYIPLVNFLDWLSPLLIIAGAFGDE